MTEFLTLRDIVFTLDDMDDLVRASGLVNLPELIESYGGDSSALLDEVGLDPVVVGDYNRYISYTALTALVGRASEELRLSDFGLRASRVQNLRMLGPIAVLAINARSVEEALVGVGKYLPTYSPAIKAELVPQGRTSQFTFAIVLTRLPYRDHLVELAIGVILGMFRLLLGPQFVPDRVTFQHPPMSAPETYAEHFGDVVPTFGQRHNSLSFPSHLLTRRPFGGDEQAHALARQFLGSQRLHQTIDGHVTEMIDKLMPLGACTLPEVASALMIHPRALQRQLHALDLTFGGLVDRWRRDLALELLARPDVQMSAIAAQLGYSEQSTFTRSCTRWFGRSPRAQRELVRRDGRRGPTPL